MTATATPPADTTTDTTTKPTATTPTEQGTEYVILEKDASGYWHDRVTITARSAEAAIREAIAGDEEDGAGTFVAIPARSWKPVKVTPQTVTTLKLEEAK